MTMHIEKITETELQILEALVQYRFLTASQMMRIGVTKAKRHLYATLEKMSKRNGSAVGSLDFGVLPGKGRLPKLYFITPQGADIVMEIHRHSETIAVPKRVRLFNNDYFHRVNCVDFHIAVRQWANNSGVVLDFFETYYDADHQKIGSRHYPKTRIALTDKVIVPDVVFSFTTPDNISRLCIFEMHNGRETLRVEKQLLAYVQAINEKSFQEKYDYQKAVRILSVYDSEQGRALVVKRMRKRSLPDKISQLFFTNTLNNIQEKFIEDWVHFDSDEPVNLF